MANTTNLENFLTDVANAIRTKTGSTEGIFPSDFANNILSISGGDANSMPATATPEDIISPKTAYVNNGYVEGAIIPEKSSDVDAGIVFNVDEFTLSDSADIITYKIRKNIMVYVTSTHICLLNIDMPGIVNRYDISVIGMDDISRLDINMTDTLMMVGNSSVARIYLLDGLNINIEVPYAEFTHNNLAFSDYYNNMLIGSTGTYSSTSGNTCIYLFNENATTYTTKTILGGMWYNIGKSAPQGPWVSNYNSWFESRWSIHKISAEGTHIMEIVTGNNTRPAYILGSPDAQYVNFSYGTTHNFRKPSVSTSTVYRTIIHDAESMGYFSCGGLVYFVNSTEIDVYDIELDKITHTVKTKIDTSNVQYFDSGNKIISLVDGVFKTICSCPCEQYESLHRGGCTYYNPYKELAEPADVLYGKTFINYKGRQTGTMMNNAELIYNPSQEEQVIPAGYTSGGIIRAVTNSVDVNIIPENIKKGVPILGVEGAYEGSTGGDATSEGALQAKYLLEGYSAIIDGKWVEGTMPNHGDCTITATSEDILIPEGYYHSLSIPIIDASNCTNYYECKAAINSI